MRYLLLVLLVCTVVGCHYHDGAYSYSVSGKIIDDNNLPMENVTLVVSLNKTTESYRPNDIGKEVKTGKDGVYITTIMTPLAWGYVEILGIPINKKNVDSFPPDIDYTYLYVFRHKRWFLYISKVESNLNTNVPYNKTVFLQPIVLSKDPNNNITNNCGEK